jgi:hypothetical protein
MRVVLLLVAAWAVWLLAFNVWAWTVPELKSENVYVGYTVVSVMASVAVAIGLVAAIWRPGWGAIAGGLLVTVVAVAGSGDAVNKMDHWGEVGKLGLVHTPDRTTPWVPLDSLGSVPYLMLLVAGVLLLVGGVVRVVRATHFSPPEEGRKRAAMKSLREKPSHVRAALLLVAVWAVWLLAFVVWAANTAELQTENNLYMDLVVWSVMAFVAVAIGLVFALKPGWGEISGGLLVTAVAGFFCWFSVDALRHWGEIQIGTASGRSMSSPWVVLDSIWNLPFWVLLVAGVVLTVGGIVQVLHPTHGTTPHAGAAA